MLLTTGSCCSLCFQPGCSVQALEKILSLISLGAWGPLWSGRVPASARLLRAICRCPPVVALFVICGSAQLHLAAGIPAFLATRVRTLRRWSFLASQTFFFLNKSDIFKHFNKAQLSLAGVLIEQFSQIWQKLISNVLQPSKILLFFLSLATWKKKFNFLHHPHISNWSCDHVQHVRCCVNGQKKGFFPRTSPTYFSMDVSEKARYESFKTF